MGDKPHDERSRRRLILATGLLTPRASSKNGFRRPHLKRMTFTTLLGAMSAYLGH